MDKSLNSTRLFCTLSGLSGVAGVVLIMLSFTINSGPPPGATGAELVSLANRTARTYFGELGCRRLGRFSSCFSLSHLFFWPERPSGLQVG
jgi:hypothetical protein